MEILFGLVVLLFGFLAGIYVDKNVIVANAEAQAEKKYATALEELAKFRTEVAGKLEVLTAKIK